MFTALPMAAWHGSAPPMRGSWTERVFWGDGGYIIAPPSQRTIDGNVKRYKVADIAAHSVRPVDAARLRDFLDPRPVTPAHPSGSSMGVDAERLAAWVSGRGEGERNRSLFWAACRLAENGTSPGDGTVGGLE